ncbi:S26 family signal peptidase [Methanoculleus chikugoensis]|uniref:S26 family signal peptidase n=1 Tax=Methanoculleus chikugoensis TaxID=118126 RepID=UPI001FB336D5|nr:S26 family signal peptidase [Methanoculleus chikugoensis]
MKGSNLFRTDVGYHLAAACSIGPYGVPGERPPGRLALPRPPLGRRGRGGGIALVLFLFSGTWPAVVTIESESMVPNMNVGDLVLVSTRTGSAPLTTWDDGRWTGGHTSFGNYGDVIVYRPNGADSVNPIIHRAMTYVDTAAVVESGGLGGAYYDDPHGGYITKGDNNPPYTDQPNLRIAGVGVIEPVKKEWIVGKALVAVPLVGYLPPLHLAEFAVVIIIVILIHDFVLARRKEKEK